MKNLKLAARESSKRTIVNVSGVAVGRDLVVIAGPCSIESEEQMIESARAVKSAGADMLRGGAFKPRTSPYAFQGLGLRGLKLLAKQAGKPDFRLRHRSDRSPGCILGGRICRYPANRDPQHAKLLPAQRGRANRATGASQAGYALHP